MRSSHRHIRNASAVLGNFVRHPKETFATISARSGRSEHARGESLNDQSGLKSFARSKRTPPGHAFGAGPCPLKCLLKRRSLSAQPRGLACSLKRAATARVHCGDGGRCSPEFWFRRVMDSQTLQSAVTRAALSSSMGKISSRGLGGSIRTTRSTPASR